MIPPGVPTPSPPHSSRPGDPPLPLTLVVILAVVSSEWPRGGQLEPSPGHWAFPTPTCQPGPSRPPRCGVGGHPSGSFSASGKQPLPPRGQDVQTEAGRADALGGLPGGFGVWSSSVCDPTLALHLPNILPSRVSPWGSLPEPGETPGDAEMDPWVALHLQTRGSKHPVWSLRWLLTWRALG